MTHCRVSPESSVQARDMIERHDRLSVRLVTHLSLFHSIGRCVRVEERQRQHTTYACDGSARNKLKDSHSMPDPLSYNPLGFRMIEFVEDWNEYLSRDKKGIRWADESVTNRVWEGVSLVFEIIILIIKVIQINLQEIYSTVVSPELKDVKGQIVLITGAGHGMGREMALRFARLGSIVVCVDINPKGNQETVDMIKSENGKVYKFECDVTQREAVLSLGDRVRREVGDVDILVNNAGIMPCRPLLQTSEKEIRSMFDVNVMGNLWMLQAFLPAMIKRNHGHIVAMSSMAGLMGIRNLVPYCGTKYAVRGIMEALLVEMSEDGQELDGIKLTTVYPYIVDTGLCHKPRIRFPSLMSTVAPGDAADTIVDAVRKELSEISLPRHLYFMNKISRLLPVKVNLAVLKFFDTGVNAHD